MRAVDVSVVVATRNRVGYLADCLESLAQQQTTAQYEVVVVDNGSDDGTPELLQRWSTDHPNFGVVTERRGYGKSRALNAGFKGASGSLRLSRMTTPWPTHTGSKLTDDSSRAGTGW